MLTINNLESKKLTIRWEQLKLLSESEDILEDIVSCHHWIKERDITREEMIKLINNYPLIAEVVEYGIHGLMVSMKLGSFYWNVFTLEQFKPLLNKMS